MTGEIALVIAVEEYLDPKSISSVDYAENDANGVASALISLGIQTESLINGQATRTRIQSKVRKAVMGLKPGDRFYLFYAGHGFCEARRNYITCWDTDVKDRVKTSISLNYIAQRIESAGCNGILFVDACESGMRLAKGKRPLTSKLSTDEMRKLFETAEHCAVFSACKDDESSNSASALKHGIWTYFLLQALTGSDLAACDTGRLLTSSSLLNFLARKVKAKAKELGEQQTPWLAGAMSSTFLVADLNKLYKPVTVHPNIKGLTFKAEASGYIVSMDGFDKKKGHFEPQNWNWDAHEFIASLHAAENRHTVTAIRTALGQARLYSFNDLKLQTGREGTFLETPDFHYSAYTGQSKNDYTKYVQTSELAEIKDFDILQNQAINDVFEDHFDTLVIDFDQTVNIQKLTGFIEETGFAADLRLHQAANQKWLKLQTPMRDDLLVTQQTLVIKSISSSPSELILRLNSTLKDLREKYELDIFPFTLEIDLPTGS